MSNTKVISYFRELKQAPSIKKGGVQAVKIQVEEAAKENKIQT